jgi:hypothetical protein
VARFIFDEMASLYGRPGKKSPRRRVQEESIQPPGQEDRSPSPKQARRQRKRKRDSSQTKHNGNLPAGFLPIAGSSKARNFAERRATLSP